MLFSFVLSSRILDRIGLCILLEICLCITIDLKVREQGLVASGLRLADIGHLDCLLPQLPLIPAVTRVNILLDEVNRSLDSLIHHQFVLNAAFNCLIDQT